MTNPAIFKKITDINTFDTYPNGSLEVACRAQISDYTDGTVNIQDMAYDEASGMACFVGNYDSDGTATNTGGDTIAAQPIPLVAIATAGATTPATTTWNLQPQYDSVNITLQTPRTEQSGLVSVITLPAGKSVNWANETWIAVGNANTDYTTMGPGFSAPTSPNSSVTPLIVSIRTDGTTTFESSVEGSSRPSWGWGALPNQIVSGLNPMLLSDLVYSEQNDQLFLVGSCMNKSVTNQSFGMFVETDFGGFFDTFDFAAQTSSGASPTAPAIIRTCTIQENDVNNAPVPNRTLCLFGGSSNNNVGGGSGILGVYQPNFSNSWGATGDKRWNMLANGASAASGFWVDYINGVKGGTSDDYFTSVASIQRVTTDEEDLYVIMGNSNNGATLVVSDAPIETGATGAPTVYDNQLPLSADADVKFPQLNWLGPTLQSSLPYVSGAPGQTAYTCVGLTNRKTKVLSGGIIDDGAVFPVSGPTGIGWLLSVSRGMEVFNSEVNDSGELPQNTASFLKSYYIPNSDTDRCYIINSRLRGLSFSSPTVGNITNIATVTPITNNKAEAYFEYMLYDGIDAMIAKKLQQLGVRVTITNLEWYKQDVLKQGLDLDADFFREWATSQTEENEKREKLANFYGASRPQKRQVRQDIFDDYNNREEILKEMDRHREESPLDDAPYNDEVADDREAKKLEKDLDDKIRIQKLADKETSDEDKT